MVKFSELDDTMLIDWNLYTIDELEQAVEAEPGTGCMFIGILGLTFLFGWCTTANAPFDDDSGGIVAAGWLIWIIAAIGVLIQSASGNDDTGKMKRELEKAKSNPVVNACTSPDGGKVVFNRQTGSITYNK